MGVTPDPNGVTLNFLDVSEGREQIRRDPVFGAHCAFFSEPRPVDRGIDDPALGSQDWLTHVIVTDHPDKLAALLPDNGGGAETSCSSLRTKVMWHVGDDREMEVDCMIVCDCPTLVPGRRLNVASMSVLPAETDPLTLPPGLAGQWNHGQANVPPALRPLKKRD